MASDRVKVAFHLIRDQEGWPPSDWETLWAISRGNNQYELDNIPFFAMDVAAGDIVSVVADGEQLVFDRLLTAGGHSTVRVIMYDLTKKDVIRDALASLGCESEGSHLPSLFAFDVPPGTDYKKVVAFLDEQARNAVLEYEESALRH